MKEYKVLLEKIQSNHNYLRTSAIDGVCVDLPRLGESFQLFAEPIDTSKDLRVIMTSVVKMVEKEEKVVHFTTMNSEYRLTVLD